MNFWHARIQKAVRKHPKFGKVASIDTSRNEVHPNKIIRYLA